MIKSIIEKVILSNFGRFIRGIESDKLSVDLFGGTFQLQNISLNHEFFDSLQTPFRLAFSSIGRLSLQAPLSKLSSVPVECILEDIYVIFQFRQSGEQKWEEQFHGKCEALWKQVGEIFEIYLARVREEKKEEGMMARLGRKIIDNLQLKIKNVHVRFQEHSGAIKYGWGVTLQEISFTPTDNEWKQTFVDRTATEKAQKMFKMMNVKKLDLYWQSASRTNQDILIGTLATSEEKRRRLAAMVAGEKDTILRLTSQFKLGINPLEQLSAPIYELQVNLEPINFDLQRTQLLQMADFAQKNVMQNESILRTMSRKKRVKFNEEQLEVLRADYTRCVEEMLAAQANGTKMEEFVATQVSTLKNILGKIEMDELMVWLLDPIKAKIKVVRGDELKKKKKGWFGRGESELTEEEQRELESFIQSATSQDGFLRPSNHLLFKLSIRLEGGRFTLVERKEQERIEFRIELIESCIKKSQDQSFFEASLDITSVSLTLLMPQYGNEQARTEILRDEGRVEKLVKMVFREQVMDEKSRPIIKRSLHGEMQRVVVIYKKIFMKKLREFFKFKTSGLLGGDRLELEAEGEPQEPLERVLDLKLSIISPIFICPLNKHQCWCLSLGNLSIKSSTTLTNENFPMQVSSAYLRYYAEMQGCSERDGEFSVVNDMDFSLVYQKSRRNAVTVSSTLSLELPNFEVNFTEKQYRNLLSLSEIFRTEEEDTNVLDILRTKRKEVQEGKSFEGLLSKKSTLMLWKDYYAVLSGEWLYLYDNRKDLKEAEKISVKGSRVVVGRIEGDPGSEGDDNFELELLSEQQECYFSCGSLNELLRWKLELQQKVKEFKTIYELINTYVREQQLSNSQKKTAEPKVSGKMRLVVNVRRVKFSYMAKEGDCLMECDIRGISVQKEDKSAVFEMQELNVLDRIHNYRLRKYQPLLIATDTKLQMSVGTKTQISISVENLLFNWKPDVLLIVMALLNKHFTGETKFRIDDGKEFSREQQFAEVEEDNKFTFSMGQYAEKGRGIKVKEERQRYAVKNQFVKEMLSINLVFKHVELAMIHRESHLPMFKLLIQQIHNEVVIGEAERFVRGSVATLELYDLTGYPQQQYEKGADYEPHVIVKRGKRTEKPLIDYRYSSYNPSTFPNEERVDSFLLVEIEPIEVEYFQQVIFRLIDYSLIQIILLLTQPQMVTVNEGLLEQLNRNMDVNEKPVKVLFSRYEQIIKTLLNPHFIDMHFRLNSPIVLMKAERSSQIYYRATFSDLCFRNEQKKCDNRFVSAECPDIRKYIYEQDYIIESARCDFQTIVDGRAETLFGSVKLNLTLNRLLFEDELNVLYPEVNTYDRSFRTVNHLSAIEVLHLSRLQYLHLNKLVNFNFLSDDQHDELFIHNFKITKLLSPKPLFYTLHMQKLSITADFSLSQTSLWKLFTAEFDSFQLDYERTKTLASSFKIDLGSTIILAYEYIRSKEQKDQAKVFSFKSQVSKEVERDKPEHRYDMHRLITLGKGAVIKVDNKITGEKVIQMDIEELNVNVRTGLLQLIFEYTLIQDWVFPLINKHVPELTFYATLHKMHAELMEHAETGRLLRMEGVLGYTFHRKKGFSMQELQEMLRRKEISYEDVERWPENTYMSTTLNTNLFRGVCHSDSKREVLRRFTFSFQDKRFWKVADVELCKLKNVARRTMGLDRCLFKVSFSDVIFMQQMLVQVTSEREYIGFLHEQTSQMLDMNASQLFRETEVSSQDGLEVDIQAMTFYLVLSSKGILRPILRATLEDVGMQLTSTFKKEIFKGEFKITLEYFNGLIFRWEPMLEKTLILFHRLSFLKDSTQVFGSLEIEPMLVNVSRQIFLCLKQTLDGWKSQIELQKSQVCKDEQIQFIPHNIIRNETGYTVEIFNEKGLSVAHVLHNEQLEYALSLEGEDMTWEATFSFQVLHPRFKLREITNVGFDLQKDYDIIPVLLDGRKMDDRSKLVICLEVSGMRKMLLIRSSKYIKTYHDNFCDSVALPFDHPEHVILPQAIHNAIRVSLYKQMDLRGHYIYMAKEGVLQIMKRNMVYNFTPMPLNICGKYVLPREYVGISQDLTIQGVREKDSLLKVARHQNEMYIYAEAYLVDYYGLKLDFGSKTEDILKAYSHTMKKGNVDFTVYLFHKPEGKIRISMKDSEQYESAKFQIGKKFFVLEWKAALCPFVSYCYISESGYEKCKEFTRVLQITPQYILSNVCKHKLKICQVDSCSSILLDSYERVPFFWEAKGKPQAIKIAYYDGNQIWGYSGALGIQKNTESVVLRKSSDPTLYKVLSIQIETTETVTFVHFTEESAKYMLANQVEGTTMIVYQSEVMGDRVDEEFTRPNEFVFNVGYKEEKPFGYQMPLSNHEITVRVLLDKLCFKGLECATTHLKDIEQTLLVKDVAIINDGEQVGKFILELCFENNIKKLKLRTDRVDSRIQLQYEYAIKMKGLGVSLIGEHNLVRKEIIHLIFQGIELDVGGHDELTNYSLLIKYCRLQNLLQSNASFPILLQTVQGKKNTYFLNFVLSRSPQNPQLIKYIGISINKTVCSVTSQEVEVVLENITNILSISNTEESSLRQCEMFMKCLPEVGQSLYFVTAEIHPLKSTVTFKHVNNWGGKLLKAFSGFSDFPLEADGKKITHFSASNMASFTSLVYKHYKDSLIKMLIPMFGNLQILGSPVSFVQKIGSGFKDLVDMPAEGFEHSPLEGTKGLARGAGSLLTKTISGTFNSLQSITGSISNGISIFVDDDQFERKRQEIKNDRSEHVGKGLENAARSIANGFKNGLAGVFTQPIKGAEKNGLLGFITGSIKGVTGLIIKPVSGVFDAATKAAEGIKNTPGYFSEKDNLKFIRRHNARPFYNYCREFRFYDKGLADFLLILEQIEDSKKYDDLRWNSYYLLKTDRAGERPVLFLSFEYIFIYDFNRKKMLAKHSCVNFTGAREERGEVVLSLYAKTQDMEKKLGSIRFTPEKEIFKMVNEFNAVVRYYNPRFKV